MSRPPCSFKPSACVTFKTVAKLGFPSLEGAVYSPSRDIPVSRAIALFRARNHPQSAAYQAAITRVFFDANFKVKRYILVGFKIISRVPAGKFFSHGSFLPVSMSFSNPLTFKSIKHARLLAGNQPVFHVLRHRLTRTLQRIADATAARRFDNQTIPGGNKLASHAVQLLS